MDYFKTNISKKKKKKLKPLQKKFYHLCQNVDRVETFPASGVRSFC